MNRSATFSADRVYRYTLWREWLGGEGICQFIGLNPSTADEFRDDPTVRRCIGYAKGWGFQALCMTNIFAYRSTDPSALRRVSDPVGSENDRYLVEVSKAALVVVAAWGAHGTLHDRAKHVVAMLGPRLSALRLTQAGHPCHPLYLPKYLTPTPYGEAAL